MAEKPGTPKGNRISTDDQVKFLVSCIKHTKEGKPDFDKVATECGIVTKGAAAKRYERVFKAVAAAEGKDSNGRTSGTPEGTPKPKSTRRPAAPKTPKMPKTSSPVKKGPASKKRKIEETSDAEEAVTDTDVQDLKVKTEETDNE